ncbi:DNA polymerase II [Sansalvadorimonas sp. 2012CJ34-2]|uniref:DNA polymerase n=1 Tax=Parendozoicomonas callyspongiae TaxID=2942213 RepID=A0ABT0PJJ9_9GAMM|nr:DNA polymerase II [Sansalvadorimonas sp. 2012CJ34-2]
MSQVENDSIHAGFLLNRTSYDRSRHTEIVLWVVTDHGPSRLVIEGEQPVLFIHTDDQDKALLALQQAEIPCHHKSLSLKTFQQSPVTGLYFRTIDMAWQARRVFSDLAIIPFEADFRLHDRYLMEKFVNGGLEFIGTPTAFESYTEYRQVRIRPADYSPRFSVVSVDLECSERGQLYSVSLFGHGEKGDVESRVVMVGEPVECAEEYIQWVPDEKSLLLSLVDITALWDPDILIGWNVINFDFRLLVKRAALHGIKLNLGRGRQQVHWRDRRDESGQGFITIPGRMVVDGIDGLKSATWQFDSFSLEFVSQSLLGRGKDTEDVENRMAAINHDFRYNKPKLARYNLEDCKLVWEIFEKTRLLDYLRLRGQLTGLELDRQGGSVAAFTNLYLPRLHRAGYIAPNLPDGGGLASPGGYVMDSVPGLYRNVLVLDFKSLYPSIIRTFRIDPMGLIEGLQRPDEAIEGFLGARFSRDHHFLPDIIASLWQQRDEAKKERDDARSHALKIIMNSFYGVLGSGGCRFYDPRLASSITMRGHEIMQQTARWIEEEGHKVIYGDTDSIFVLLGDDISCDEADKTGKSLEAKVNRLWKQVVKDKFDLECFLELEYETLYTRFLMPTIRGAETGSKKRYAGIKRTGDGEKLIFKGLETVRSDWTQLAKSFQTELYEIVFADKSPENLIRQYVEKTLAGEVDDQLVYRKRLRRHLHEYVKNIPPQVRAARHADDKNRALGKSLCYQHKGWISYLITVAGPETVEYHANAIDYQHYIDKQLKPVAEGILPFIGMGFDQVIGTQQGLF